MHITDGQLTVSPVGFWLLSGGWALTGSTAVIALYRLKEDKIPAVALLSAAFFIISFIAIPIPGSTVHLLLAGLIGVSLGWNAILAIGMGLTLQALLYGMGGITTIGVNTAIMAFPAVICYYLFGPWIRSEKKSRVLWGACLAGASGVILCVLFYVGTLGLVGKDMIRIGYVSAVSHIPALVVEAVITLMIILSLKKIKPNFFL